MTALGADGRPWDVEHGRTVVCCPDCGLGIDEIHDDGAGCYICPACEGVTA